MTFPDEDTDGIPEEVEPEQDALTMAGHAEFFRVGGFMKWLAAQWDAKEGGEA